MYHLELTLKSYEKKKLILLWGMTYYCLLTADLFSKLSDEIVLCILGHLPHSSLGQVALLSTRFSRLVRDESLWRRLDLSSRLLRSDNLAHVLKRGVRILRLTVAKVSYSFKITI
jgi:hypothetical protein